MKKRGLSTVVTTLIIILLVLVAIGIVWVVIRNIIEEGAEEISLGKFTIDLDIKNVNVQSDHVDVRVKRNPGKGDLSGIKFLISDGVKTKDFEMPTTMEELAEQTFTLDYSGIVKEISIAPILKSSSGKDFVGSSIDKEIFTNKQIIENLGAVSWWRLEGNANDEIGNNHGTLQGGVDCSINGKFGKACSFDGSNDYLDCGNDDSLNVDYVTVTMWFKADSFNDNAGLFAKGDVNNRQYWMWIYQGNLSVEIDEGGHYNYLYPLETDKDYHLAVTYSGSNIITYINGIEVNDIPQSTGTILTNDDPLLIGNLPGFQYFNGIIDEVIVFNEALSGDEVKALYGLNLD